MCLTILWDWRLKGYIYCLLTLYKSFTIPHLDYGEAIYDQPLKNPLLKKTESVRCSVVLTSTGTIKDTSRKKLHQELRLKLLR